MDFSDREIKELLKSWAAISLAFAIASRGETFIIDARHITLSLPQLVILSALTVGIGFLIHEVSHKFIAQRYGFPAEFRSFDIMLVLAILMSITGIVFAAPGAVMIGSIPTIEENGKISTAGPLSSLLLGMIFLALKYIINSPPLLLILLSKGAQINIWLALFNLIPLWNLDGSKILRWNFNVYATLVTLSFFLFGTVLRRYYVLY